jgi:KEOPS complex subunit Pcc1
LEGKQWESGSVPSADTRLPEPPTMSAFSGIISINAREKTKAIFDSINADNKFYPENPTTTKVTLKKNKLEVSIDSDELSHLRANINSVLRLVQASYDSLESAKIKRR